MSIEFDPGVGGSSFANTVMSAQGSQPAFDEGQIEESFARAIAPQGAPRRAPRPVPTENASYVVTSPSPSADLIQGGAAFDPGVYIQKQLDELERVFPTNVPQPTVPLSDVYGPVARAYQRGGSQDVSAADLDVKNPEFSRVQEAMRDTPPSGSQLRDNGGIASYTIEQLSSMGPTDPRLQEPYFLETPNRGPVLTRPLGSLSAADEAAGASSARSFYNKIGGIVDLGAYLERRARADAYDAGLGRPEEIAAYQELLRRGFSPEDAARDARTKAEESYSKLEATDPFAARASDLPLPTFGLPVLINALNPLAQPATREAALNQLSGALLSIASDPTNLVGAGILGSVVKGGRGLKVGAKATTSELRAALGALADHPRISAALDELALRPGAESASKLAREISDVVGTAPNKELDNFMRDQLSRLPDSHIQALASSVDPGVARNAIAEAERRGIPIGDAERLANRAEDLAAAAESTPPPVGATSDADVARIKKMTAKPGDNVAHEGYLIKRGSDDSLFIVRDNVTIARPRTVEDAVKTIDELVGKSVPQDLLSERIGTVSKDVAAARRTVADLGPEQQRASATLKRMTEEASARRAAGAEKILDRALGNKYLPQNAPAVQAVRRALRSGVELTADALLENRAVAQQLEQALIGAGAKGTGRRAQRALADKLIERETQRNVAIGAYGAKREALATGKGAAAANAAADQIVSEGAAAAATRAADAAKTRNAWHVVEGKSGFFVENEAGVRNPSFHKSREGADRMAARLNAPPVPRKSLITEAGRRGEAPPPRPPTATAGGPIPPAPPGTLMLPAPPPRLALPAPGPEGIARFRFTQAQQRRWAEEAARAEQIAKKGGPQTPAGAIARVRREIWRRAADAPQNAIALTPSGTYIAPPGYSQTHWNELSKWQKVTAIYNTTRVFKAMGDISATLRQGGVLFFDALISKDPKRALQMVHTELTAFKDETFAIRAMKEMETHPRFEELRKKTGMYIADWRREVGTDWQSLRKAPAREEEFQFSMADRIPGVGRVARASERSFSLYLNTQRWQKILGYVEGREALAAQGLARPMSDREYKALGRSINAFTGRGVVPQGAGAFLNALSFSIRFAVSRPQMYAEPFLALGHAIGTHRAMGGVAARGEYELAKMQAKALGAHAAGMIGVLGLAHLAGADVGLDRDSPDFLSIKIGHENIDLTGGVRPYLTLLFRLKDMRASSLSGNVRTVQGKKPFDPSVLDLASRFVASKLHPSITTGLSTLAGEDIAGNPYGPRGEGKTLLGGLWDVGTDLIVPLPLTDVVDGMLADGPIGGASALVATEIGGGVIAQKKGNVRHYITGPATPGSSPTPSAPVPGASGRPGPTLPPRAGGGGAGAPSGSWWR